MDVEGSVQAILFLLLKVVVGAIRWRIATVAVLLVVIVINKFIRIGTSTATTSSLGIATTGSGVPGPRLGPSGSSTIYRKVEPCQEKEERPSIHRKLHTDAFFLWIK
jgi:hypothetical protein